MIVKLSAFVKTGISKRFWTYTGIYCVHPLRDADDCKQQTCALQDQCLLEAMTFTVSAFSVLTGNCKLRRCFCCDRIGILLKHCSGVHGAEGYSTSVLNGIDTRTIVTTPIRAEP